MKLVELSALGRTVTGKTPSSNNPEDFGDRYCFVTPTDSMQLKFIAKTDRSLSQLGVDRLRGKLLPPNSVMVSCIGSAMGKVVMNRHPCVTNQQFNSIVVDQIHYSPDYLYYALKNNYRMLRNAATGSTSLPLLNKTDFDRLKLVVHDDKNEQLKVANILSGLDAKIELNHRINAELEGMAKLLYDYWFVQFDFPMTAAQAAALGKPKLAGHPYRASGGKMIYNETLKRDIPEGWEAKSLARLISVTKESVNPADSPDKTFKLFSIPVFDSTGTYSLQTGSDIGSNKFIVTGNDILVSKLNPWFSRVIYTEAEIEAVCSTEFVVWQTTASWTKAFLYMVARSPEFVCFCTQSATGTSNSHKRVNPEVMMSYSVPWDSTVVQSFGERVNPILLARQINQIQNQELTQLRDWLLPMLMNGQVTIG